MPKRPQSLDPSPSPSADWWSDAGLEQQFASNLASGRTACCCDACEDISACSTEGLEGRAKKKCKKKLKQVGKKCKECPADNTQRRVDLSKSRCEKLVTAMKKGCDCM